MSLGAQQAGHPVVPEAGVQQRRTEPADDVEREEVHALTLGVDAGGPAGLTPAGPTVRCVDQTVEDTCADTSSAMAIGRRLDT